MLRLFFILLFGCTSSSDPKPQPESSSDKEISSSIVVYSGRGESMVGELFTQLEKELGIDIEVQYGSTSEMVTRMLTEGEQSPADIIFAQDSGHLGALSNAGALEKLPTDILEQVDARFRDDQGTWVGTSGRLRVLVYDSTKITAAELPKSLKELADPKWKGKLGWAPSNGSFQAHVSALRHLWGEDETKEWLQGVQKNEPKRYPKNSPQVKAANEGTLVIGWVNHYYLHSKLSNSSERKAKNYSFPAADAGNIMMLAGVGVRKNSTNQEAAHKVINALISEKGQSHFTLNNYEYPTRPNVQTNPDVPDINIEHLVKVPQKHLADLAPTRTLLQELALQ